MSRGFFGGAGGNNGRPRPGASKSDPTKKKSFMAVLNYSRKRNKTMNELVKERNTHKLTDYKEMVEDMLDAKMTSTERKRGFNLPGTAPAEEKVISKGRQAAIDHFKMQRAKQRMKVRDKKVEVIPKNYMGAHGGWIDKKGKIRNHHGAIVMEVNLNTGVITNKLGLKVGKYNPNSYGNDFKIQRLIDRYTKQGEYQNPFGGKGDGRFNPFGTKD